MTYQEFLRRVQEKGGLASAEDTTRAVTATLETLRECLTQGGFDTLPREVRHLLPGELMS